MHDTMLAELALFEVGMTAQERGYDAVCSDTMSDRIYPYTATLSLGETMLLGCGYTSDEPFSGDPSP